ncbi:cysteine desulfurase [Flavobacteriales bacterium]|jgi:cysteine desulfurase/selenocysteine lyase|nr:cysteine desulfurase [Flavobacteriales bacterium]|tara:strand:- start:1935 stop:3158 length:1224 start_codon:yes stop_codon:yes gene_type:complete
MNLSFDVDSIRQDFPILSKKIHNKPLVYFDNAATSQTPVCVIDCIKDYYEKYNSNIHRGVHSLSDEATNAYENARNKIKDHFNINESKEVIFTSGTTHSINIVSNGFSKILKKGDEIIVSGLEHHSNIVPWQMMIKNNDAKLRVIPLKDNGELDMDEFKNILSNKTKIVFLNHVSNALGIINPIKEIIDISHKNGAIVLIDGAQSAAHFKIDLQKLNVDFFTASAHKLCGPTGVGFLYGKEKLLSKLDPLMGGGEMISDVTFSKTTYADLPHKFEAGTPNIAGVIAFGKAIDYLNEIGLDNIEKYEKSLLDYANSKLKEIDGLKIYGDSKNKTSVISFNIDGIHSYDIGSILDKFGIAVRTGQHCAQPIMDHFGIDGTVRASFSFINTIEEIDHFYDSLIKAKSMLS